MPGNKVYTISRIADQIKRYWSFGSIAQAKYVMRLSDKYLVEAKTLFEYKQYSLVFDALNRSDNEVIELPDLIGKGVSEKKNMSLDFFVIIGRWHIIAQFVLFVSFRYT